MSTPTSITSKILTPGIHWLFAFIPISLFLEYSHASAPMVFFSAALSIIPIARLISTSTENLATYTGDAVGGLLNATFGNLPELIIAFIALKAGLHEMVLASIAGAILANLLLALGVSFLVGGIKFHYQEYNATSIRMYSSMMMIAVLSLIVPSAFNRFFGTAEFAEAENSLNIFLSIALLATYGLYLVFMLKTHADFFTSGSSHEEEAHENRLSLPKAIGFLVFASVLAAFMSEILVGAAEETGEVMGMSSIFIGVVFLAVIGGAAESISAIVMASKNKVDLSIGIALGSSIQIALFIAPVLVLASLFVGPEQMNLSFNRALIWSLFLGVILASMIAGDGRSNWYKGIQLILVYLILAMMFYFIPESTA
ncbi:calcium/proton exchanger [Algoriphagus aestuariicola]|uniref:Ca(2+)/H(+) antiporter n=1 Tax=Algoriphagus aestuariicola TaxID=1852016 RepID=A0ABS3BVS2_9BACT|nr:calcium/proton exchanger [Algoriphagus aestuariicola]MBN7803380.1 calcium/proton exchanger [Algoriphagus aestuariicola]